MALHWRSHLLTMLILAQLLEGRLLVRISSSNATRKMSLWSPNATQNSTRVRSSDLENNELGSTLRTTMKRNESGEQQQQLHKVY